MLLGGAGAARRRRARVRCITVVCVQVGAVLGLDYCHHAPIEALPCQNARKLLKRYLRTIIMLIYTRSLAKQQKKQLLAIADANSAAGARNVVIAHMHE